MKRDPTDESTVTEHLLGHCAYASKNLDEHNCPGIYQRFFFGKVQKGRKKVDGIVYLDEYRKCNCLCHIPEDERPKRVPRKRAARKPARKTTTRKKK